MDKFEANELLADAAFAEEKEKLAVVIRHIQAAREDADGRNGGGAADPYARGEIVSVLVELSESADSGAAFLSGW